MYHLRGTPDELFGIKVDTRPFVRRALAAIKEHRSQHQVIYRDNVVEDWTEPGWTGLRGDILRALMALVTDAYEDLIHIEYGCKVTAVDVNPGTVTVTPPGGEATTRPFDLIVGADGAGSVVRRAMNEQITGFTVQTTSLPNYLTMIELDRLSDQLDPTYLQALATRPFCVAGAIKGDEDSDLPRWFCAIGTRRTLSFEDADTARRYLRKACPRVLDLASPKALSEFAERTCYHIGQKLLCSQLHGGAAVLIGDAAGPLPPIGQGVNAAMEAAMVLSESIDAASDLTEGAESYDLHWKPELDAVSWISEKMLFENRLHTFRANLTMKAGINVIGQAKSSQKSYAQVRADAQRFRPLWA